MGEPRTSRRTFGVSHHDYRYHPKELEPIFKWDFPKIAAGATDIGKIGYENKIPQTTLYRWYHTWKEFPAWWRWLADDRDGHLPIFTAEEEVPTREFMIANYVIPGTLFTNDDFRRIATEAFLTKCAESGQLPQFNCSNGFTKDFKSRNRFSSGRAN